MAKETANPTALETLLRQGSDADLRRFLLLLQPPEIADLIEALRTDEDRARAFKAIVGKEDRSNVLRDMEDKERASIVEDLPAEETAELLGEMQSDDAVDVLQDMKAEKQQEVLTHIEPGEQAGLRKILTYPEESAGGIMQTELVRVHEDWTAREAIEEIRRTRDEIGELHETFVVDDDDQLKGWVSERALILAEDETPMRGLTIPAPVSVLVTTDQEEIASLVRDYDVSSVPVVDDEGRLVGRVLVDDIVDVIEEEATEDITRLGGSDPREVYEPSVLSALKSRAPWLLITFAGGIAAAEIIQVGEDYVRKAGILFAFIPVIMGMGGGISTQAATVTVRSLALGRIGLGGVMGVVRKELFVGLIMAAGAGVLVWAAAALRAEDPTVAWIAAFALFGSMFFGALFGVLTPLFLNKLGADPAVATSPFVTTTNDVLGSTLIILCTLALL